MICGAKVPTILTPPRLPQEPRPNTSSRRSWRQDVLPRRHRSCYRLSAIDHSTDLLGPKLGIHRPRCKHEYFKKIQNEKNNSARWTQPNRTPADLKTSGNREWTHLLSHDDIGFKTCPCIFNFQFSISHVKVYLVCT